MAISTYATVGHQDRRVLPLVSASVPIPTSKPMPIAVPRPVPLAIPEAKALSVDKISHWVDVLDLTNKTLGRLLPYSSPIKIAGFHCLIIGTEHHFAEAKLMPVRLFENFGAQNFVFFSENNYRCRRAEESVLLGFGISKDEYFYGLEDISYMLQLMVTYAIAPMLSEPFQSAYNLNGPHKAALRNNLILTLIRQPDALQIWEMAISRLDLSPRHFLNEFLSDVQRIKNIPIENFSRITSEKQKIVANEDIWKNTHEWREILQTCGNVLLENYPQSSELTSKIKELLAIRERNAEIDDLRNDFFFEMRKVRDAVFVKSITEVLSTPGIDEDLPIIIMMGINHIKGFKANVMAMRNVKKTPMKARVEPQQEQLEAKTMLGLNEIKRVDYAVTSQRDDSFVGRQMQVTACAVSANSSLLVKTIRRTIEVVGRGLAIFQVCGRRSIKS